MVQIPDLSYDIDKKAFSVFRGWIRNAKEKYPTWDVFIEDKQEISKEFQNEILSSLKSISKEKYLENNLIDWCIGYLEGRLISGLSILWSMKYLDKPERYHHVLWLKSISMYLDVDKLTLKRINRLYKHLQETEFPFKKLDQEVEKNDFSAHHLLSDLEAEDNWETNKDYLENMIYNETLKMIEKQKKIEIPDLDEYFLIEELKELVLKNPFEK